MFGLYLILKDKLIFIFQITDFEVYGLRVQCMIPGFSFIEKYLRLGRCLSSGFYCCEETPQPRQLLLWKKFNLGTHLQLQRFNPLPSCRGA